MCYIKDQKTNIIEHEDYAIPQCKIYTKSSAGL